MPDQKTIPEMTPDEVKRRESTRLWTLEVSYYTETDVGQGIRSIRKTNMLSHEVVHDRQEMFSVGILVPIDPGHWLIIMPKDIEEVHLYKQSKFFEP